MWVDTTARCFYMCGWTPECAARTCMDARDLAWRRRRARCTWLHALGQHSAIAICVFRNCPLMATYVEKSLCGGCMHSGSALRWLHACEEHSVWTLFFDSGALLVNTSRHSVALNSVALNDWED
eukprot:353467-Chlamydomonas_euryale.AAC.5